MKIYENGNNLIIENAEDFDLKKIFECGQCFRFDEKDDGYFGVAKEKALYLTQKKNDITLYNTTLCDWENIWCDYFDMSKDYAKIRKTLSADSVMKQACEFGRGIRLLNQEPFECLISFIISASNNIPRIKKIIASLCENFGEEKLYMGKTYYTFPTPEALANLNLSDLSVIRAGFRDKYILSASRDVVCGKLDLNALKNASCDYAKSELLKLYGVGEKVADCILLFSLKKHASFPVDVWIKRIMEHCYFDSEQDKKVISKFAEEQFGENAGLAQQYLFYWARENKIGI